MSKAIDRFAAGKWGVFNHYLFGMQNGKDPLRNPGGKITSWDACVREFDVERLAAALHKMGAGYYFITLMQGGKYMCAPNAAYDRICGTQPGEACSTRDLPMELAAALGKYGIDLYLYYTGDGPHLDPAAGERMGMTEPRTPVTPRFLENWSSVLQEFAMRYGNQVKGWWIDGCYGWLGYNRETLDYYDRAIHAGNPEALISYNYGGAKEGELQAAPHREDYFAGERNDFIDIPGARLINGEQTHVFAPLGVLPPGYGGGAWGFPGVKRDKDYMLDYIRRVNAIGAPVTVDIVVYRDGSFDPEQEELLAYVGRNL